MQLPLVISVLTLFLAFALTLYVPEPTELLTIPPNTLLGGGTQCNMGKRLSRQRPMKSDCANAILQLRDNDVHGLFHSGGVRNMFQLPERRSHRTCAVVVEMKDKSLDDEGTWTQISNAAGQLNTACVGTSLLSRLHGGWTYTGRTDSIKVTLMYVPFGGFDMLQNGTAFGVGGNSTGAGLVNVE